jgi:hypothetical protein
MKYKECKDCLFYYDLDNPEDPGSGWCRRYPPLVPSVYHASAKCTILNQTEYAATEKDYWCGEWKSKTIRSRRSIQKLRPNNAV